MRGVGKDEAALEIRRLGWVAGGGHPRLAPPAARYTKACTAGGRRIMHVSTRDWRLWHVTVGILLWSCLIVHEKIVF